MKVYSILHFFKEQIRILNTALVTFSACCTLSCFAPVTVSSLVKCHRDELSESAYRHQLLGLNLLFLLSQNRVSEFHTELERLSAKDLQTNVYIRHPVSLEQVWDTFFLLFLILVAYSTVCFSYLFVFLFQYLMEGSYNKVFLAKGNIPAESYTFFIDILLDTIRQGLFIVLLAKCR